MPLGSDEQSGVGEAVLIGLGTIIFAFLVVLGCSWYFSPKNPPPGYCITTNGYDEYGWKEISSGLQDIKGNGVRGMSKREAIEDAWKNYRHDLKNKAVWKPVEGLYDEVKEKP